MRWDGERGSGSGSGRGRGSACRGGEEGPQSVPAAGQHVTDQLAVAVEVNACSWRGEGGGLTRVIRLTGLIWTG